MDEEQFKEWLGYLGAAEEWLQATFELMDGIDGCSLLGESAHVTAMSAIRTVRAVEDGAALLA